MPKIKRGQNEKTMELFFGSLVLLVILLLGAVFIGLIVLVLVWELVVYYGARFLVPQN